jgi:hypothetical protein
MVMQNKGCDIGIEVNGLYHFIPYNRMLHELCFIENITGVYF